MLKIVSSNRKGFSLIELFICLLILAVLITVGTTHFTDLRDRAGDTRAYTEGRDLIFAVSDAFLESEDVKFDTDVNGIAGAVGTIRYTDSSARMPIYTLPKRIRVRMTGHSTPQPGGGFLTFEIWHVNGTPSNTLSGRKEYYFEIQEDANVISLPPR
jgi:prepilin-type N-terminal cleavage/methylation domain-containing protein